MYLCVLLFHLTTIGGEGDDISFTHVNCRFEN